MKDINEVKYGANSSAMRSAAAKVFKNIYAKVKAQSNADYSKIFVAVKQGANAPGKLPLDPAAMEIVPWVEDVTAEIEGDGTAFLFTDSDIMDVAYDVAEQLLDALRKDGKIPPKGMREGKRFADFRKQLDEQSYQEEGAEDVGLLHSLNIARKTVKTNELIRAGGMNKWQAWDLLLKYGTAKEKAQAKRNLVQMSPPKRNAGVKEEVESMYSEAMSVEEGAEDVGLLHSLNIARKTVKMNDVMINVMGGMNKRQAWELLLKYGTAKEKAEAKRNLVQMSPPKRNLGVKEEVNEELKPSSKKALDTIYNYIEILRTEWGDHRGAGAMKVIEKSAKSLQSDTAMASVGNDIVGFIKMLKSSDAKKYDYRNKAINGIFDIVSGLVGGKGDAFFRSMYSEAESMGEDWKSLKKTKADLNAIRASGKKVSVQHGEGDTLYRVSKPKKSVKVKEEAEQIDEAFGLEEILLLAFVAGIAVAPGTAMSQLLKGIALNSAEWVGHLIKKAKAGRGLSSEEKQRVRELLQKQYDDKKFKRMQQGMRSPGIMDHVELESDHVLQIDEAMAKVTLNPKTKIGYEIRDVGPGGKSTVSKRENFPKEEESVAGESVVRVREAGHQTLYRYKGKYYIVSYSSLANETMIFAADASGKPTSYADLWMERRRVDPDVIIKDFLTDKFKIKKNLQVTVGR